MAHCIGRWKILKKTSIGNFFWPRIYDDVSAREAAKQGWVAALVSGGITFLMVVFSATPMSSLGRCLFNLFYWLRVSKDVTNCGYSWIGIYYP